MNIKTTNLNTSWKNNKNIFYEQIELNLKELSSKENYPQHWKDFLVVLDKITINSILDIGCGCGAYYGLLQQNLKDINYTGIDYSTEAINIARNQWKQDNFFVKNVWDLDNAFISDYDALHSSALFDVMDNGDEALNFILGLHPKIFIISRMAFTDTPSYYDTYLAYDKLETCRYYHNTTKFIDTCKANGYMIYKFNTNLLLIHDEK